MGDYIVMAVIAAVGVIALEHYLFKQLWPLSIAAGVIVALLSIVYQWWLQRRRNRALPRPQRRR